jgi:hypothetical protein
MWRKMKQGATSGLAAFLLVGMVGCVDLAVDNPNQPDRARALGTAGDVESLIAGAFLSWSGTLYYSGPTMAMSAISYEHTAPWANAGVEFYARIPRVPTDNVAGGQDVLNLTYGWTRSYRAIAAVAAGLSAVDNGDVDLADKELRARAYGKFAQGLAHATIAALYDSGFVYDETSDVTSVQLVGYQDVMAAALGYFADAATLAGSGTFTVPAAWMGQDVSSTELAQLAHSAAAVFRASVARDPTERAAVDWAQVTADAGAGVTTDWAFVNDCINFCDEALYYRMYPGWTMMPMWIIGMADQSGAYQTWFNTTILDKREFISITPDTRFPQGADEATQFANKGSWFEVSNADERLIGARPDRGTWRWSYYKNWVLQPQAENFEGDVPMFTKEELDGLVAEAAYRSNPTSATVVSFINATRTMHGLTATDAAGTNAECVPKLPDGSCGDLWEMFKWEKRLETQFRTPLRIGWYLDSRGWGDLTEGSLLNWPVPYGEMQSLGRQPYNVGGVGGYEAAPNGTYGFPGPVG